MKSYGQMIYEAYVKEHGAPALYWMDLGFSERARWDRIGQDVATQMHPPDAGPNHLRTKPS